MRTIGSSPQLLAMSVAFDDHGETVPGRGTTIEAVAVFRAFAVVRTVGQQAVERRELRRASRFARPRQSASRSTKCGKTAWSGREGRERGFELGYAETATARGARVA
jgi:hypothetical protein